MRPSFLLHPPQSTLDRAKRALLSSVLTPEANRKMVSSSIPLQDFIGESGKQKGYTQRAVGLIEVEDELLWLIRVGVLRREVDGQGITNSFRLTPMGIRICEELGFAWQPAPLAEVMYDWLLRRLPY
jgi:hypothetical protein